jgi:multiple sugar transport system substrate-binding protein
MVAGAGVAVVAALGGAAYLATRPPPPPVSITSTVTATAAPVSITSTVTATATPEKDYYYDPSLAGTTVNFLASNVPETTYDNQFIPLFEQETGIKVNLVELPEDQLIAKVASDLAMKSSSFDMLDVGGFGAESLPFFMDGYLEPLDDYMSKTPSAWAQDDILPVVLNYMKWPVGSGKTYAFPAAGGVVDYPYFYRTDVLSSPAKKIDEMISDAQSTNNPPKLYGFIGSGTPDVFSYFTYDMFLWANNQDYIDADFHPLLDTDEAHTALEQLVEISKYAPSWTSTDSPTAAQEFSQGKGAQSTNFWTWYALDNTKTSPVYGKTGYAPHPGVTVEPHMLASETFSINAFSPNKDAAWSYMSFILSPRISQLIFNAGYGATMRNSVINNPVSSELDPLSVAIAKSLVAAQPVGTSGASVVAAPIFPHVPRTLDFINICVKNLGEVFAGKASVTDGLNAAQSQLTALLKEAGVYK